MWRTSSPRSRCPAASPRGAKAPTAPSRTAGFPLTTLPQIPYPNAVPERGTALAGLSILFVCTGNTCRSPLAAAIAARMLAARLGCAEAELPARGFLVQSAGVMAAPGEPATALGIEAARAFGADLSNHTSRPVDGALVSGADVVLAMTRGHAMALALRYPEVAARVRLFCRDGGDLDDPIGGDAAVYAACAQVIASELVWHLAEWLPE